MRKCIHKLGPTFLSILSIVWKGVNWKKKQQITTINGHREKCSTCCMKVLLCCWPNWGYFLRKTWKGKEKSNQLPHTEKQLIIGWMLAFYLFIYFCVEWINWQQVHPIKIWFTIMLMPYCHMYEEKFKRQKEHWEKKNAHTRVEKKEKKEKETPSHKILSTNHHQSFNPQAKKKKETLLTQNPSTNHHQSRGQGG